MSAEFTPELVRLAQEKKQYIQSREQAIEVASMSQVPYRELSEAEISSHAADPDKVYLMYELSRLSLGVWTSASNRNLNPRSAFSDLEEGLFTYTNIHKNPVFEAKILKASKDPQSNLYESKAETVRDGVRFTQSASVFYLGKTHMLMIDHANTVLTEAMEELPDKHPTKPLMVIEANMFNEILRRPVNTDDMLDSLRFYQTQVHLDVPRLAAANAMVFAYGRRHHHREIIEKCDMINHAVTNADPNLGFYLRDAQTKNLVMQAKNIAFGLSSPFLISRERRQALLKTLIEG